MKNSVCEALYGTIEVLFQKEKDALVVQFEELACHG
jgi:hypothetical protein